MAMSNAPCFRLNGESVPLEGVDPRQSLLRWLQQRRLGGTKEGCGDGDCGACTVALLEADADGRSRYHAVNSCLLPLGFLPGREIYTVEALADGETLHPVQQAMIECAGSQCGYCTPGFVMSLFVGGHEGELGDAAIEGNLCRCTGYRPIRAAARRLAQSPPAPDRFDVAKAAPRQLPASTALPDYHSPASVDEAITLKTRHPQSAWIAGGTDLGVGLSRHQSVAPVLIALDRIAELQALQVEESRVRIGAGVPLSRIERELHGRIPLLDDLLHWFAGRQVRNRATLGGNLGSASPIGDLLPALLALDALVHLRGPRGARSVPAADFFLDYRRTARADDELVMAVDMQSPGSRRNAGYKVAKRQTDDISIVVAAFILGFNGQGLVDHARLAFGGVAAVPLRAHAVEDWLQGRRLDADTLVEAGVRLRDAFTPISDHRASADYRRALCANLFARFVAERCA
ncbi:xanthine dehydrogenase small subunit [Arenimonas sp.]|uniref:xanthine dehydrogenase small subunit n=1 Tax=Arenimonas sp. TaxID=1872635 RepID=UPI0039E6D091